MIRAAAQPLSSSARGSRPATAHAGPAPTADQLAAWLRPWLLGAMAALFVARPLWPSESVAWRGDGLTIVMAWWLLAIVWLALAALTPRVKVRAQATDAAVLALLAWHTVAALRAVWQEAPRPAWNMLWEWLALGLGYFLVRQLVTSRREARALAAVLVALALAQAAYGLRQYFVDLPATRAEYRADPEGALRRAGQWYPPGSRERWLFEQRLESKEPLAAFALSNSLAGFLAPWTIVAGAVLLVPGRLDRRRVTTAAAALVPLVACLILTKSRSAYLAAALGGMAWGALVYRQRGGSLRRPVAIAVGLVALALVAGVLSGGLDLEVLTEAPKSLGYRLQYWQATWGLIRELPWFGCGPGNFGDQYTRYKLPEASEEIADPHNFLLEVWATAGTPAAAALVAVGLAFWRAMFVHPRRVPTPDADRQPVSDGVPHLLGGLVAGFGLAWFLGPIVDSPLSVVDLATGVVVCGGWLALAWRPWIRDGELPATLAALGVAVLSVNLLAAGGIGFPGVSASLWVLVALGLGEVADYRPEHEVPRLGVLGALAVALVGAAGCFLTAYQPVLISTTRLSAAEARAARAPAEAESLFRAAAAADRWSAEPWRGLTALEFVRWDKSQDPQAWFACAEAAEQTLLRRPRASALHQEMADYFLRAYQQTGNPAQLRTARQLYRRAVALYPNSPLRRAGLAVASELSGDLASAIRQRDRALAQSAATPHEDQKLPPELQMRLEQIGRPGPGGSP